MAIRNHSQADDLRARFKVPEWRAFCHTKRLRNSPPRLKLVLFDSTTQTYHRTRLRVQKYCYNVSPEFPQQAPLLADYM